MESSADVKCVVLNLQRHKAMFFFFKNSTLMILSKVLWPFHDYTIDSKCLGRKDKQIDLGDPRGPGRPEDKVKMETKVFVFPLNSVGKQFSTD